ncbi:oxaloacetate-decarboxylating malate dehydrogenase [Dactylosporangium sp. NPDC050688]|uniref:oxaloacetate-decarboxylating malate dehydrogenase n=1 Tax=Dactylosporangium sp. NPDC050688 TaxID=3157217 RepID=UPI0033C177DD
MFHDLARTVTAVDVNRRDQLEALNDLGCDGARGNYLADPTAHEAADRLFNAGNRPPDPERTATDGTFASGANGVRVFNAALNDPDYLGTRHARARGARYDEFIDAYVRAATKLFPDALLHWEDFGPGNGWRILQRYRDQVCTFNDDMQGTGAIVLAAALGAGRAAGTRLRDQRIVVFGAGTAGVGIADQLRDAIVRDGADRDTATRQIWCLDRPGLLTDDMTGLRDYQTPYARPAAEVADWRRDGGIGLHEVVARVRPTMLIGTSTVHGAFTEAIVREMAAHTDRPIIFPLSNPTERIEAMPDQLIAWTDGRGLIPTGIPVAPVTHRGVTYAIDEDLTLKEAALRRGISDELYERIVVPEDLTHSGVADARKYRNGVSG